MVIDGITSPHGTEMLAVLLAITLRQRGWRIVIHTGHFERRRSAWAALLRENQIKVYHPGFWRLTRFELPKRVATWRFWRWCRRFRPDVIWSPTNDVLTCLVLKQRPKDSAPFFVHDPSEASACPNYPKLWFEVCQRVDALSVHGERQLAGALQCYKIKKPVEVVYPSSMAPKKYLPLGDVEQVVRFGQFGRIFSVKGTLFAVAAFAHAMEKGLRAELHFFGDGPLRGATEELAGSLGIQASVFFHGPYLYTDLDRLVGMIDVGLMPSIYEGFGLVMLELMSRGRPVIATAVGSCREVLEQFDAGIVVPRADTTGLAAAMVDLGTKPARLREMANNARTTWEAHFTPEAMTDRYLEFWRRHGLVIGG